MRLPRQEVALLPCDPGVLLQTRLCPLQGVSADLGRRLPRAGVQGASVLPL